MRVGPVASSIATVATYREAEAVTGADTIDGAITTRVARRSVSVRRG